LRGVKCLVQGHWGRWRSLVEMVVAFILAGMTKPESDKRDDLTPAQTPQTPLGV
jgi:hypothetical protein